MDAIFHQALSLHRSGQTPQAERLWRGVLDREPRHFDTLHVLGIVRTQRKDPASGLDFLQRAVAVKPDFAPLHNNMGIALRELARHEEALASYGRALALQPQYPDALNNRGNVLRDLQRYDEALASYEQALVFKPDYFQAHNNRGITLRELGHLADALDSHVRAIALQPGYAEAHNSQGRVLEELDRLADALASYDRALALKPDYSEAHISRGQVLEALGRQQEALACYDRALAAQPDHAEALNNRGALLQDLHRHEEALASYDRALKLSPNHVALLGNRGSVLSQLKRHEDATDSYERLLAVDVHHPYALGYLLSSQLHVCDWRQYSSLVERIETAALTGEHAALPFVLLPVSNSPAVQLAGARSFVADKHPAHPSPVWSGEIYAHERIRLAYVSADFHDHATAHLMAGLFETHDRSRFEVFAISFGPDASGGMRERLANAFEHFVDVRGMGDREVALLLKKHEIDIAIDLKGFTRDSRPGIFASRGAPVQVNYLGYPGTMGADYIDYAILDPVLAPESEDHFYSEQLVRLPDTYQPNDSARSIADTAPSRTEVGLPASGFVFCCFNNPYKITPDVFGVWMRLLDQVPGSVMWLLEDTAAVARNLRREAHKHGIAAERLVFAPRAPLPHHLARHRLADLFLDTLPFNAHTTASDALWAGLPLLTCQGATFAGRVAASLLQAVGLPDMVTHNLASYAAKALELATQPAALADVRTRLAHHRHTTPLFDTQRLCRNLESAYETMWKASQAGLPPQSFSVLQGSWSGGLSGSQPVLDAGLPAQGDGAGHTAQTWR